MTNPNESMKCPRRFHPDGDGDCLEDRCAWWMVGVEETGPEVSACAIKFRAMFPSLSDEMSIW